MTRPPLSLDPTAELPPWAKKNLFAPLRWLLWLAVLAVLGTVVVAPLGLYAQTLFATAVFLITLLVSRAKGRGVTLWMMLVSVTVSSRYIYWRIGTVDGSDNTADATLSVVLLVAEVYAFLVLLFGFIQTAWPLKRHPVALPADPATWPTVDIFIPSYNEPLNVVRATVLAARDLDWPAAKLAVYVLDDGRRDEFRAFCAEAGVHYLTRPDNKHAKAGNINHALRHSHGDYIAIFDCDHVPTRGFLQLTLGWLVRDSKMAMVQTPHHFYSPDPFERNLGTFRKVPNEGELFYGVLQCGNDTWDATFFCGSCAVIKRGPLEEIGGIAPETVTEDAHTMLKLHRRGYHSAYLDLPLAAGLATESLSAHVGQRIRWARGMSQIFRVDNPFFGRGLRLFQRLCYAAAMMHFFYGIPRLIFLTAPLVYLLFDAHIFNAPAPLILAYALPHLAHATLTNSRIQREFRHSFWAEVYEAVLAFYIAIPTTLALISPKLGKFNVTAKGGIVEGTWFDSRIARPYLLLIGLNLAGVGVGLYRALTGQADPGVVGVNLGWTAYNLIILSAALAVAWEKRQRRVFPRVDRDLPAVVWFGDDRTMTARTLNLSMDGLALAASARLEVEVGQRVSVALLDGEEVPLPAEVVQRRDRVAHLRFVRPMAVAEEAALVRAVFGSPDAWLRWREGRRPDRPGRAMAAIFGFGVRGALSLPKGLLFGRRRARGAGPGLIAALGVAAALASSSPARAQLPVPAPPASGLPASPIQGAGTVSPPAAPAAPAVSTAAPARPDADAWTSRTLADLGLSLGRKRYGTQIVQTLPFFARGDEVLTGARLSLELDPKAPRPPGATALRVEVNGELVGELPLADATPVAAAPVVFPIDSRLLGEQNQLSFSFTLPPTSCPTLVPPGSWTLLADGVLATRSAPLPLPASLGVLPLPFFDEAADAEVRVPFAVLSPLTPRVARAASLAAAWFGLRAGERLRFPTTLGALPPESAVVLGTAAELASLPGLGAVRGPMVAMLPHPAVPGGHAKLLVITGRDVADLEVAAERMVLDYEALATEADRVALAPLPRPAARAPYDAPRWVDLSAPIPLSAMAPPEGLVHDGALGGTLMLRWRMPSDVFTWPEETVDLELAWAQDGPPGVPLPTLKLELNGRYLGSLAVPSTPDERRRQTRRVRVPVGALAGYNELAVHIVPPSGGFCPNPDTDRVTVALDPTSALHLEGFPRFAELPDIQKFVSDGFPFTRLADLAETAIVLPDRPTASDLATALSFAAHTAAVTGYPPIAARFVGPDAIADVASADLVVIGDAVRQPLVSRWSDDLPIRGLPGRAAAPDVPLLARVDAFVQGVDIDTELARADAALGRRDLGAAFALGLESMLSPGRSVVVLTADGPDAMPTIADLRGYAEATSSRSDALVQVGERRMRFQLGGAYAAGTLPPVRQAQWFIARHWLLLLPALFLAALLGAWVGRRRLAHVAYKRLSAGGGAR